MTATTSDPTRLTPSELAAWRGMLRVHSRVLRELDAELEAAHGLSLTSYEVLLTLSDAPGRALRMSELAESVLLSRSGCTRLVDRLERDGLVERRESPGDARGALAALTRAGRARLARARPTHLAGVRRHFTGRLRGKDLAGLARAWERVLPGSAGDDP